MEQHEEKSMAVMIRQEKRQEGEEPSRTEPSRTVGEASITVTVPQSRETRSTSNLGQQGDQDSSAAMSSPTASRDPAPMSSTNSHNPTFLLTQAAHISTFKASGESSSSSSKLASPKVTPPTIAIESPGSPQSVDDSTRSPTSANTPSSASKANRKRGVPHIYRDYFNVPDTIGYVRKKTGGVTQPFPEKLHELLDHEPEPTIVSWLPHGRAFLVRKPKEFTQDVMPR
jgi:hypothetical protein